MAKGDHIFVHCRGYSHHGIDCGNGRVIHFDFSPKRKLSSLFNPGQRGAIRETTIQEFANGREIQIREYDKSDMVDIVIERAQSRLDEKGYCLLFNNCEHFSVWCKTGKHSSTQVDAAKAATKPIGKGVATLMLLRSLTILPTPLKPMLVSATIGYSIGSALSKYSRQRAQDAEQMRS